MKIIIITIITFLILITNVTAQVNLVPNPSFEYTVQCPYNTNQILFALPWTKPNGGTSDLFNTCTPSGLSVSVPSNVVGYQYPRTGNGYAGIYTYQFGANLREYLQAKLDSVLLPNHIYCAEFYVSPQDSGKFLCNNMGMYFSDTAITSTNQLVFNVTPQIDNNPLTNPLTNKILWTRVSGSFIASGGEQYVTIGNFTTDANSDTVQTSGHYWAPYYYVDDVSVVDCTGVGVGELENNQNFKLFPNPNNGQFQLDYKLNQGETGELRITDVTGKLLKSSNFNGSTSSLNIDANTLDAGAYYYEIKIDGNKAKTDKLIIIK